MGEKKNCHDCRHLKIESGGRGKIFFKCAASGRVMEAVNEKFFPWMVVTPPAWCEAGHVIHDSRGAELTAHLEKKKMPGRLPRVQPSWKTDEI